MGRSKRAQTSIDFAIAMGVFLVALTTVIAFMPTMNQPFTDAQDDPLLADRLAAQVTDQTLGAPDTPSVLNATCTFDFFKASGSTPCRSFDVGTSVNSKLGVSSELFLNVTLRKNMSGGGDLELLCASSGIDGLQEQPCGGKTLLAAGPSPPNRAGSVTTARRYARVDNETVYVVVKVWS